MNGGSDMKSIRIKFCILMVLLILIIAGSLTGCIDISDEISTMNDTSNNTVAPEPKNTAFEGNCGVAASAQMGTDIIGYPTLTISVQNISGKDISAIRFYAVPYDVYGEEIERWITSQRHLYTDDMIRAGQSDQLHYSFIESSIKTIRLYVYSVYFSDGTEWGNKDATKSTILENGTLIEVSGEE